MKHVAVTSALVLTFAASAAFAEDDNTGPPPKGTVCFTRSLRHTDEIPMSCKGLGKVSSVAELYERGYRVVSTGIAQEAGTSTIWLIIERVKSGDNLAGR